MFWLVVVTMLAGQWTHILLDRSPDRRTPLRRFTLGLLWIVGGSGFWVLVDGLLYLSPSSIELTPEAAAAPGLVHWELAWTDITLGVLLLGCIPLRHRGSWLDAAVLAMTMLYLSNVVGALIEIFGRHSYTSYTVWSIPTQLIQVILAVTYLSYYRRLAGRQPDNQSPEDQSPGSKNQKEKADEHH